MKCLGCALRSPKEKTGNHKEQRDAHAGGRVQNIGDIPVNRADTVRVRDIPVVVWIITTIRQAIPRRLSIQLILTASVPLYS